MAENARRGGPEPEVHEPPPQGGPEQVSGPAGAGLRQRRRRPRSWQTVRAGDAAADRRQPWRDTVDEREARDSAPTGRRTSLKEGCRALLFAVRARSSFERVVVAVRFASHAERVAAGVTEEEALKVEAALRENRRRGKRDWPTTPLPVDGLSRGGGAAFSSPVLVSFTDRTLDFSASVVVDAVPEDPELQEVLACVREAAPDLARLAEVESLRARLHDVAAQGLRRSRVLDMLPDPVLVTDQENRILLANTRAEQLFTTRPGDSRGRNHAVETNNLFFSAFRARAALQDDVHGEHRELYLIDPADGADLLFEVFFHPFATSGSRPDSTVYVLRDITDLRKVTAELEAQYNRAVATEHQARRESERLNVIIENAGVPILVTDRQTNIVLMNREAEHLFEPWSNGVRLTGMINDFLLDPGGLRQELLELLDSEGAEHPVQAVSRKIVDDKGEPSAVVTVLHDLTHEIENERLAAQLRRFNEALERRVTEATRELAQRNEQLEVQRAELERASRLKSEFLTTMTHELRTPINATLGYNALLREGLFGPLTGRQQEALDRMKLSAEHLLAIINDILDLSKVEAGRVILHPADVDVAALVEAASQAIRPAADRKSLEVHVDVQASLPVLHVDEGRLRQVLAILLSNAVKFTHSGSVTLRVRLADEGRQMVFEVVDTGIGIAASELEAIFEDFRQVDQSITREHGGTGLGLAIGRKLLALMGGQLEVESEPGQGATFRVRLPLRAEPTGR